MDSALTPREIQARIRGGASVAEVAAEAGVDVDRIEGFAGPVLAEREHMTRTALAATVRRRGDGSGHRRLADIIRERLQVRGIDSDTIEWDAWRQMDLKWQLVGLLDDDAASRCAEFVFDPRGRFSIATNGDARWMIGEELPGAGTPDEENTVDFNDELALVRAVQDVEVAPDPLPGDDVPHAEALYEVAAHTSELDDLYDMMSGISEDSVRIYVGFDEFEASPVNPDQAIAPVDASPAEELPGAAPEETVGAGLVDHPQDVPGDVVAPDKDAVPDPPAPAPPAAVAEPGPTEPEQDSLIDVDEPAPAPSTSGKKRRRAQVPSWDEIMFGGPGKSS